jgi:hypothetical protein
MAYQAYSDPGVILGSKDPLDEQAKGLSLRKGLAEEQAGKRDLQTQQALKQAFQGADTTSPQGQQELVQKVMRIDPQSGMQLQGQFQKQSQEQVTGQLHKAETARAEAQTGDIKAQEEQRNRENFTSMLGAAARSTESAWKTYEQEQKTYPASVAESRFRKVMADQKGMLEANFGDVAKKITDKFDPEKFVIGDVPAQLQQMKAQAGQMAQQQKASESPVGKVMDDFNAGRISKQQMEDLVKKETHIPVPQSIVLSNLLTPEAKKAAAEQFNKDGTMPPALSRNPAAVAAIANEAAKNAGERGQTGVDTTINRDANKADAKSLGNLTKQSDMIHAFESTALKNLDMLVAQSERVPRTEFILLNKALETGQLQVGSVETAKLFAIVKPFVDEYAKILSGQTGAAGASDTARKEAAGIISPYMTKEQIRGLAPFIKQELNNRTSSLTEQGASIQKRMHDRVTGNKEETPTASPASSEKPKTVKWSDL